MPDAFNAFQAGQRNTLGSGLNPFSPPRPAPPPMPAPEEQQLPSYGELVAKAESVSEYERLKEEEHSKIGTMALQAARGALDAVLAPGALLGAEWEGIGSILRIDPLEKLGRDIGQAASGKSAMEAIGFVAKGGGQAGLKASEKVARKVEDQEKAWPILSMSSRLAGNAALVLASGAGSATGGAKAMLAMGAAEGAGAGAQAAYEEAAPLTDVMTSAMLGSAIGLAATGVGVGAGAAARRITAKVSAEGAEALAPEALEKMAAKSAFKATIDRQTEASKVIARLSPEDAEAKVVRIGKEILDSESLEDVAKWHGIRKADELPNVLWAKKEEAGAALGQMRRELDQEIGSSAPMARPIASWPDEMAAAGITVDGSARTAARTAEQVFGDAAPSAEKLQALFTVPGYKTTLNIKPTPNKAMEVWFTLTDETTGAPVGTGMRKFGNFYEDGKLRVVHDHMYLQPEVQGKGVGSRLMSNAREIYPELGVTKIRIPRASEMGRYAWARQGAEPDPEDLATIQKGFRDFAAEKGQSVDTANMSLKDIADHQLGKEFLTGPAPKYEASIELAARPTPSRVDASGGSDVKGLLQKIRTDVVEPLQREASQGFTSSEATRELRAVARSLQNIGERLNLTEQVMDPATGALVTKKIPVGSPRWWAAVDQIPDGQVKIGFGELEAARKQIADRVYLPPPRGGITPPPPRSMRILQKIERNIARHIDEDAESALDRLGRDKSQYVQAKQRYSALKTAYDGSKKKADAILGNRNFSLTDYGVGIGALASGGAPGAIAALPMTLANKWLRENGRALTAVTLRRTARALQGEVQGGVGLFARGIGLGHKVAVRVPKYIPNVAREIGREAATEHERWRNREKALQRMVQSDQGLTIAEALRQMPGIPAGLTTALSQLGGSRVRQLLNDLPKPKQDFRGPTYQRLSRSDVKLANAMYEATFDPLSIFEDYKSGEVDYSKVQYVWKMYPGFQRYCQAAVVDMLTQQMTDDERAAIPDLSLTQMDFFFGFNGALQPTLTAGFSSKFTAIGTQQEADEQSQLKAPLKLTTTTRTMAQRMARQ